MSDTPWYVTFFGEAYLRIYSPFLPAERTALRSGRYARPLTARARQQYSRPLLRAGQAYSIARSSVAIK